MAGEVASCGWLALVATPIGNLDDITLRALSVLRDADLIAAEDTRRARKLLTHFDIPCRVTSYHAHNEHGKTASLLTRVHNGEKVVALSDAGTPCVSDPGYLLMREAVASGIEPTIIPGVSALTYAVAACGLPVSRFAFGGFLPPKGQKRQTQLREWMTGQPTLIVFESPHRVERLLNDVCAALGPETRMVLLREATKLHEEHIRGSAGELVERYAGKRWKGEFTVVLHPIVAG